MIQQMLAIWSLVPLRFLKPAWTSANSKFMYCWSLAWRILSIKKAREFQKNIYFCLIDYAKAFDCVDHNKLWKILREKCRRFLEITSEMTQNIWDILDAYKRHTLWPEGQELCKPASLRFILYSFPGQNSRLYDEAFSVERVCMIVIVQQKGVKLRFTAESVQSPFFLPITGREW